MGTGSDSGILEGEVVRDRRELASLSNTYDSEKTISYLQLLVGSERGKAQVSLHEDRQGNRR